MLSALEFFGERVAVAKIVARRIQEARINSGMVPEELGELANLDDPLQVAELEMGTIDPREVSVSDLMAIATQLGLSIERLMPFRREMTAKEKQEWEEFRVESGAGPVVSAGGSSASIDPDKQLELFIRIRALQDTFGAPS